MAVTVLDARPVTVRAALAGGTAVLLRPVGPADADVVRAVFAGLSPASRRRRFLAPTPRLTAGMLRRLVDDVDGVDHVALAMETADRTREVVGIGRWVRAADGCTADVAIAVVDRWQHRGAGMVLASALLTHARASGIQRVAATIGADNHAALALAARALPAARRRHDGPGVFALAADLGHRYADGAAADPPLPADGNRLSPPALG